MCGDDDTGREKPVDPAKLDRVASDRGLWRGAHGDEDEQGVDDKAELRRQAVALLALVIQTQLSSRQREIVNLYFYGGKTQAEIAEILGISQQVISKQLFGVMRKGKRVGGAIRKLEKLLRANGIEFE
ncbi:MAG: sigma-70 family RNA polymerase sigma factor [Myxococcota bacterium]|nr:sigma-70 family RNA polymerase sigma factor [Myxococcota bacterium]